VENYLKVLPLAGAQHEMLRLTEVSEERLLN